MNNEQLQILSTEISTDPLTRGYSGMTDVQIRDSLNNTIDRPNTRSITAIVEYLATKKHRTNQGNDTTYAHILGRLYMVANAKVGDDTLDRGAGNEMEVQHIAGASEWLILIQSLYFDSIDFDDTDLPYGYMENAGVWSSTHSSEIKALSQSQRSRASELGLGRVSTADVTYAKTL